MDDKAIAELYELAKRDDVLSRLVPPDLRQILGELMRAREEIEKLTKGIDELTMQCQVNDQAGRIRTALVEEASKEAGKWRSEYELIKGKLYKLYSDE